MQSDRVCLRFVFPWIRAQSYGAERECAQEDFLLFLYFLTDLLDSFFKLTCIHASLLEFCRNLHLNHWKLSESTKKHNGMQ